MNWWIVGLSLVTCLVFGGGIGGYITEENKEWYNSLNHPAINPPDWLFGVVWPILYLFISFAAGLSFNRETRSLFFLQYFLNFAWTPLFFGLHALRFALLDSFFLNLSIYWLIGKIHNDNAMKLLVPYFLWTIYATFLSAQHWYLNRM